MQHTREEMTSRKWSWSSSADGENNCNSGSSSRHSSAEVAAAGQSTDRRATLSRRLTTSSTSRRASTSSSTTQVRMILTARAAALHGVRECTVLLCVVCAVYADLSFLKSGATRVRNVMPRVCRVLYPAVDATRALQVRWLVGWLMVRPLGLWVQ